MAAQVSNSKKPGFELEKTNPWREEVTELPQVPDFLRLRGAAIEISGNVCLGSWEDRFRLQVEFAAGEPRTPPSANVSTAGYRGEIIDVGQHLKPVKPLQHP
jgi:hypothetical protein